nr:unnamed protein product [Spirometra erinaceieuropaei]
MHALFAGHMRPHPDFFSGQFSPNYTHPDLLWHAAARQGMRVGLYHFPFCSDKISAGVFSENLRCIAPPEKHESLNTTITKALSDMKNGLIDFANIYCSDLDHMAHHYGPLSPQFRSSALNDIDEAVSNVLRSIDHPDFADLHFLILSDHGMTDFKGFLRADRLYLESGMDKVVNYGSMFALWPKPGFEKMTLERLRSLDHARIFTPSNVPSSWNLQPSSMPPLLLVADTGYIFSSHYHSVVETLHPANGPSLGAHGYPPEVEDMQTALFAVGPRFAKVAAPIPTEPVSTHHVFRLLTHLMGMRQARNDDDDDAGPLLRPLLSMKEISTNTLEGSVMADRLGAMQMDERFIFTMATCLLIALLAVAISLVYCCVRRTAQPQERALVDFDEFDDEDGNILKSADKKGLSLAI